MSAVIFSAPQAWGKTRNAKQLAREHGCKRIVDDWDIRYPITPDAIHLTNCEGSLIAAHYAIDGKTVRLVCRGSKGGAA